MTSPASNKMLGGINTSKSFKEYCDHFASKESSCFTTAMYLLMSHPGGYNYCYNTKAKYMPGTFRPLLNKCLNKMLKEQREKKRKGKGGEQQKRKKGGREEE